MPALEKKWLINQTTVETVCLLSKGDIIGNEEYRSVENETLLTFFLIDKLINISYNMCNIY